MSERKQEMYKCAVCPKETDGCVKMDYGQSVACYNSKEEAMKDGKL